MSELENTRKKKRRRKNEDLVKQLADDFNDAAPPSLDEMTIKSPVKVKPGKIAVISKIFIFGFKDRP